MTKAVFIRTVAGHLIPGDDAAREALHGIPPGALVACEVSRPRNLKHLRLYWKLCGTVGDAVGVHRENVSDLIKLRTGHYVTVKSASGLHMFPRSISFSKLDQAGFAKFFDEACRIVCAEFIPNMRPSELRDDILRMAGVPVENNKAA